MASLTGKFASLNPFARPHKRDDDKGDEIDEATIGGGGYSARAADVSKHNLAVSRALKAFLAGQGVLSEHDVQDDAHSPVLLRVLEQPHAVLPAALTDRSFRLTEYFISSSHNTYLKAHQLFGHSGADAYAVALSTGSRCVEIDAWDGDDDAEEEPKVTHGYTLVSNVSLRAVCETIRDVVDKEAAAALEDASAGRPSPVVVSLENHCGAHGQQRIVEIMTEVLGHRLLAAPLPSDAPDEHVTLAELGAKVIVMVEHHIPGEPEDSDSSSSSDSSDSSDDDDKADKASEAKAHEEYRQKKKTAAAATSTIIPALAALGVYAQSVKPSNNSWFEPPGELTDRPHHHLINVSESGLAAHLATPANSAAIARHNARHLMRVFPKGTRISSRNLNPVPFWAAGAQVAALNWQRFDATMQLNEALFRGSDGYVLKPAALRSGGSYSLDTGRKVRLRLHVAGAAGIPLSDDLSSEPDKVRPYLTCSLVHPADLGTPPAERKRKTSVYKQGGLKGLLTGDKDSPATDPVWDEVLEWEYDDNELVFLRLLVKNDESWSTNSKFAVAAVRLSYVQPGWRFIRMLDLKGRETTCSLLVKFDVQKV